MMGIISENTEHILKKLQETRCKIPDALEHLHIGGAISSILERQIT
jgi:hypothetical protein